MKLQKPLLFNICTFFFLLICLNEIFFAFIGYKPGENLRGGLAASGFVMMGAWAGLGKSKAIGFLIGVFVYILILFLSSFIYGYFK